MKSETVAKYGFMKGLKMNLNTLCIVVIMKFKLNGCIYFKIFSATVQASCNW